MNLVNELEQAKIIAIIRGVEKKKILPLVEALYNGGIKFIEITFLQGEDNADIFESIKTLAEKFKGKLHLGSGTVLTKKQVRLAKKAGVEFVVSPNTNGKVIRLTKKLGMLSIPGVFTASEIMQATRYGADFVKLFPASTLGASYIKAIRSPFNEVKILSFGGINLNNIDDFIKAGVSGFGLGASLIDKEMLQNNDYEGIKNLAEKFVEKVK